MFLARGLVAGEWSTCHHPRTYAIRADAGGCNSRSSGHMAKRARHRTSTAGPICPACSSWNSLWALDSRRESRTSPYVVQVSQNGASSLIPNYMIEERGRACGATGGLPTAVLERLQRGGRKEIVSDWRECELSAPFLRLLLMEICSTLGCMCLVCILSPSEEKFSLTRTQTSPTTSTSTRRLSISL